MEKDRTRYYDTIIANYAYVQFDKPHEVIRNALIESKEGVERIHFREILYFDEDGALLLRVNYKHSNQGDHGSNLTGAHDVKLLVDLTSYDDMTQIDEDFFAYLNGYGNVDLCAEWKAFDRIFYNAKRKIKLSFHNCKIKSLVLENFAATNLDLDFEGSSISNLEITRDTHHDMKDVDIRLKGARVEYAKLNRLAPVHFHEIGLIHFNISEYPDNRISANEIIDVDKIKIIDEVRSVIESNHSQLVSTYRYLTNQVSLSKHYIEIEKYFRFLESRKNIIMRSLYWIDGGRNYILKPACLFIMFFLINMVLVEYQTSSAVGIASTVLNPKEYLFGFLFSDISFFSPGSISWAKIVSIVPELGIYYLAYTLLVAIKRKLGYSKLR